MTVVLVTNDDGIEARGIRELVEALAERGFEVYVAAPLRHMSGAGKSFGVPARYGRTSLPGAVEAWWVDSTPATAVYIALYGLIDARPDLVVSGVNRGPNMGLEDILTSGTVGAALEAALHGVPAVAASYAVDPHYDGSYRVPASMAAEAASIVLDQRLLGPGEIVNLNVPVKPRAVAATVPAWNNYRIPVRFEDGIAAPVGNTLENRYWDRRPGTDVWAVMNGLVSVTVLDLAGAPCSCPDRQRARRLAGLLAERLGLPLEDPAGV